MEVLLQILEVHQQKRLFQLRVVVGVQVVLIMQGAGAAEGHQQKRLFQLRVGVGVQAVLIMHLDGDKILAKAKIKVAALEGGNY